MEGHKRWLLGTVSGFFFGFFLGLTLLGSGVIPLDSAWLTILPIAGLLVGLGGSLWAPRGMRRLPDPVPVAPRAQGFAPSPPGEPASTPSDTSEDDTSEG